MVYKRQTRLGGNMADKLMGDSGAVRGNLEIRRHLKQARPDKLAEKEAVAPPGRDTVEIHPRAET
jgi:hypothetical protein